MTTPSSIFDRTSNWFERAQAALVDELPCRRGCSHCCVGLFPVTILDRQEIRRGLRCLPHGERVAIGKKAAEQVERLLVSTAKLTDPFIDTWRDRDLDRLVKQFDDLPCPALRGDGTCAVYDYRPLVCRSMGIPSEGEGVVHGACRVQTSVPLIRLSSSLRREESYLAGVEAEALARMKHKTDSPGEELLLPFAFLPAVGEEAR